MNRLPASRSAMTGRTFSRSWSASDYDPIERYTSSQVFDVCKWLMVALAAVFAGLLLLGAA